MTLLYMKTNLVTSVTIPDNTYVTSEDTVYTVDKLYNKRPSYPFRFDGTGNQWIKVEFTVAQNITAMAIFNHNFPNTTTITLDASAIDGNWSLVSTPVWREENLYSTFGATLEWWKLNINAGAVVTPQVGELFLGQWAAFENAFVQPGRKDGPEFFASDNRTHMGQDWIGYYSNADTFTISIKNLTTPSAVDELQAFLKDIWENEDGKFVFIPDHNQPHVYYVQVVNRKGYAEREIYGTKELREWKLELRSLTNGITLL